MFLSQVLPWEYLWPPENSWVYGNTPTSEQRLSGDYFVVHQWWFQQPSNTRAGQKGWSKVTMVGRLCFMARLQIKSNIDTMHDLSPFDWWQPRMLAPLMQDMHHSLPIWCCLFEAKGDFPQNIDPDVTVKKSHYLMTSMPCKPVLQDRNFNFQFWDRSSRNEMVCMFSRGDRGDDSLCRQ